MIPRPPEAVLPQLLALLPPGWVWPTDPASTMGRVLSPLAAALSRIEGEAARLQGEAVGPREAVDLLEAYERLLAGAGDGIDTAGLSAADRQSVAHQRWIARGGQSPAYFIQLAAALGTTITITEQVASQCDLAECGDEITPDTEAFVWIVSLPTDRLIDAECDVTECGDALGDIVLSICEPVIRAYRPAHTEVVFSYV